MLNFVPDPVVQSILKFHVSLNPIPFVLIVTNLSTEIQPGKRTPNQD